MAKTQKPATVSGFDELWIFGGVAFTFGALASMAVTLLLVA